MGSRCEKNANKLLTIQTFNLHIAFDTFVLFSKGKVDMVKKRICVVDDEEDLIELLRHHLTREGYEVTTAMDGEEALELIENTLPDLVLLDLMLPGMDGLTICRKLKLKPKTARIPIVIVSAKGEESDVVVGLELGADDYISKPFSMKVLIARVRSVLRRNKLEEEEGERVLRIHDLVIDRDRRSLHIKDKAVDLTFTEFSLLYYLAGRPGRVMTRDQLIDAVRGEDYAVTDRAVDVQVVGLRKKLGKCAEYIQTVRGVGYTFKE